MSYLSVVNFWKFQNADAWKKAKTHPPWFKCYVHRDRDIDALPLEARLLWIELLAVATRYSNVLEADLNWLWAETRIKPDVIAEMLPMLIKGGWLSQTETRRRSRKVSRGNLPDPGRQDLDVDVDLEEDLTPPTPPTQPLPGFLTRPPSDDDPPPDKCPECGLGRTYIRGNGPEPTQAHADDCSRRTTAPPRRHEPINTELPPLNGNGPHPDGQTDPEPAGDDIDWANLP